MLAGRTNFGTDATSNALSSDEARRSPQLPLLSQLLMLEFEFPFYTSENKKRPSRLTVSMAISIRNRCGGRAGKTQEDLSVISNDSSLLIAIQ